MSAENPEPQVYLTLDEVNELNTTLSSAFALIDVLNASYNAGGDGPEHESLAWISGLAYENLLTVKEILKKGMEARQEQNGGCHG